MSRHYACAYELKDSFFEMPEEKQIEAIKKVAKEYHLPMSLDKVLVVLKAEQLFSVADEKKIKEEIKRIRKEREKKRHELKIQMIEADS